MSTDRTAYWREYARKNAAKRKATKAAYRARNKEKIAAYKRAYRAGHPSSSTPRKPRIQKPKTTEAKTEALISLKERFAAFRASRQSP